MSIFQESFPKHIDTQLRIRSAIAQKGNSPQSSRFGATLTEDKDGTKIRIDNGAFYTSNVEKQCVLRMSSGVDIDGSNKTAQRFVLEGGTPKEGGGQREGFIRENNKGNAYGDPNIFSDAGDDFGIVPMPGITDANIRTKSAYGSLREAKVNFICHNRRQLEVLERLYMRPGFPILLEWQWTPYIDNNGDIENLFPKLQGFFNQGSKIENLQDEINKRKIITGGNYDGMLGICKNFDFKVTPAGGYECSTELTSMGEVLEGLKGKRSGNVSIEEDEERELDEFEYYLSAIKYFHESFNIDDMMRGLEGEEPDYTQLERQQKINVKLVKSLQSLAEIIDSDRTELYKVTTDRQAFKDTYTLPTSQMYKQSAEYASSMSSIAGMYNPSFTLLGATYYFIKGVVNSNDPEMQRKQEEEKASYESQQAELNQIREMLDRFIIQKGEKMMIDEDGKTPGVEYGDRGFETRINQVKRGAYQGSPHTYIRWDFLAHLLNSKIIEKYQKDESLVEIVCHDKNNQYFDYINTPLDPKVSIPRKQNEAGEGEDHFDLSSLLNISLDPTKALLPHQIHDYFVGAEKKFQNVVIVKKQKHSPPGAIATSKSIGFIYLNVDHLLSTWAELKYNDDGGVKEDFGILQFLKKIWEEDINEACAGSHNFLVHQDKEKTTQIRIIDLIFQNKGLQPENLYKFDIQDNKSIVRDFNFNSTIPSSLSATMAIVAQNPDSISDLEGVTVNSLNKNLTSRFTSFPDPGNNADLLYNYRVEDESELINKAVKLDRFNRRILIGRYQDAARKHYIGVSSAIRIYNRVEDLVESLMLRYPLTHSDGKRDFKIGDEKKGGQLRKKINTPKSAVIPLKFTCKIDGIGGIVIGNVFRIDPKRLPKSYNGKDVAFIVHAETQEISTGQDWTTEITGQLILLDIESDKEEEVGVVISPGDVALKALGIHDNEATPNADKLRQVLDAMGYTEKETQISENGDIQYEMFILASNVFIEIKKQLGDKVKIEVTGGNDNYHKNSKSSRHKFGKAIDFVIRDPEVKNTKPTIKSGDKKYDENLYKIETILRSFSAAKSADGNIRFINEYSYPSAASNAPHFHLSWGQGTEGGPKGWPTDSEGAFKRAQNFTGDGSTEGSMDNLTLSWKLAYDEGHTYFVESDNPMKIYDGCYVYEDVTGKYYKIDCEKERDIKNIDVPHVEVLKTSSAKGGMEDEQGFTENVKAIELLDESGLELHLDHDQRNEWGSVIQHSDKEFDMFTYEDFKFGKKETIVLQ